MLTVKNLRYVLPLYGVTQMSSQLGPGYVSPWMKSGSLQVEDARRKYRPSYKAHTFETWVGPTKSPCVRG